MAFRSHLVLRCDLATANVVARWIAADLADDKHVTSVAVGKVLEYAEASDRAAFLPRTATAQEALDAPDRIGQGRYASLRANFYRRWRQE